MTKSSRLTSLIVLLLAVSLTALLVACGSSSEDPPAVSITMTETPAPVVETATEAPEPVETATPTPVPTEVTTPVVTQEAAAEAAIAVPAGPPDSGRWIDVNVTNFTVSLMDGETPVQVIGPVGVGEQIDTGVYESTQTGLYYVYNMDASLTYDAPYDTYISHWVGFDPALANGFHSFLKDADGNVVDASTGRISNGCIRTGNPEAIYAFAEIGMPVYVHF